MIIIRNVPDEVYKALQKMARTTDLFPSPDYSRAICCGRAGHVISKPCLSSGPQGASAQYRPLVFTKPLISRTLHTLATKFMNPG